MVSRAEQGLGAHALDNAVKTETLLSLANGVYSQYSRRLWPEWLLQDKALHKEHEWQAELPPAYFSCPEKAVLELLMDLPDAVTFEHANELIQGLVNLSPRKLDKLLKACNGVKVKRLFFWFAKRQNYPWFGKLDVANYDLGLGNRAVATGGKLNAEYSITVPAHMAI